MTKNNRRIATARRLVELMDAAKLSPDELAKRLGANRSTVYHWRTGFRTPSPDIQPKLAKVLGTSVAALNGWAA